MNIIYIKMCMIYKQCNYSNLLLLYDFEFENVEIKQTWNLKVTVSKRTDFLFSFFFPPFFCAFQPPNHSTVYATLSYYHIMTCQCFWLDWFFFFFFARLKWSIKFLWLHKCTLWHNLDCFHTTAKCVFWILIRDAHFELKFKIRKKDRVYAKSRRKT